MVRKANEKTEKESCGREITEHLKYMVTKNLHMELIERIRREKRRLHEKED